MTFTQIAALLAAVLLAGVAVFQAALALGAPYGAFAWGGKAQGALPERLRRGSALAAVFLVAMAAIVLVRGGLIYPQWQRAMVIAVWVIFLFMVVNTFANLKSASAVERRVMAPLTAVVALLLAYLQLTAA